jgi:DNA-binding protein H-NS
MATRKKTPRTLDEIQAEIRRLEAEAQAVRQAEVAEVIGRIKEAIKHYGLTAEDLGLAPKRRGRKPGAKAAMGAASKAAGRKASAKKAGVAKYGDGQGNTWTGHGKRPKWFLDALASGKSASELLL